MFPPRPPREAFADPALGRCKVSRKQSPIETGVSMSNVIMLTLSGFATDPRILVPARLSRFWSAST
jgi:hypothetical protein